MVSGPELRVRKELSDALTTVLGETPTAASPVVILAACLDELARGYGLSENSGLDEDPHEPPEPALSFVSHFLADGAETISWDRVRDRLGLVFEELSDDPQARRVLNKSRPLSAVGLLHSAQIYWNLEARGTRSGFPIRSGQAMRGADHKADIKVPRKDLDFATMTWSDRVNEKGSYKSSGQSFRVQGARLAVLAAKRIVEGCSLPEMSESGALLTRSSPPGGESLVTSITWPEPRHVQGELETLTLSDAQGDSSRSVDRVQVGRPGEVGSGYQRREFDDEVERLWADGGDRRVWLCGGPGLGKSFTARRIMQDAITDEGEDREKLLVWVDSADETSVLEALAAAADQLAHQGLEQFRGTALPPEVRARNLLQALETCTWRWLVVLDNADPDALIRAGLLPSGRNPRGRVLITTLSHDPRIASNGRKVRVEPFTSSEAESYLRSGARGDGSMGLATSAETRELAESVGHHPLALSIAASTILANSMSVADWIAEFLSSSAMDDVADEPDSGGYPAPISATWRVALANASRGLSAETVERAVAVAALQDPDGHPTWLWDRDAVAEWVGGGALERRHGMPAVVRRLRDYGVVELRGDTWSGGRLAIHQLAARAVREHADPRVLVELAAVLAGEWLLYVSDPVAMGNPEVAAREIRRNVLPLARVPGLPAVIKREIAALRHYDEPSSWTLVFDKERVSTLAPFLENGGSMGRAELAAQVRKLGDSEVELGRVDEAQAHYEDAHRLYEQTLGDDTLPDVLRAEYVKERGELNVRLGCPDEARADFERAAQLYTRVLEREPKDADRGSLLANLAVVHDRLGDEGAKRDLTAAAREFFGRPAGSERIDNGMAVVRSVLARARHLDERAGQLEATGLLDQAKQSLEEEAGLYESADLGFLAARALRDLSRLQAESLEWEAAEGSLTRAVACQEFPGASLLVQLASVQRRLGRQEQSDRTLSRIPEDRSESAEPVESDGERALLSGVSSGSCLMLLRTRAGRARELQRWEDAAGLSTGALDLARQRADAEPGEHDGDVAAAHQDLALALGMLDRLEEAVGHSRRSVEIYEFLAELAPDDEELVDRLGSALTWTGLLHVRRGENDEAEESYKRAIEVLKRGSREELSRALLGLSGVYGSSGRVDEAIACLERRVDAWTEPREDTAGDPGMLRQLADAWSDLGEACHRFGRLEEAGSALTRAIEIWEVLAGAAPDDSDATRNSALNRLRLWSALHQSGDEGAMDLLRHAVADLEELARRDPGDMEVHEWLAGAHGDLGKWSASTDRLDCAATHLTRSVALAQMLVDLDPGKHETLLVVALRLLSEVWTRLGREAEASETSARADEVERGYPDIGEGR